LTEKEEVMLQGDIIRLRTVRESDLDRLYEFHQDIVNRGEYFPIGVMSEPLFKRRFQETGFWQQDEGMLVILGDTDDILGHIEFFQTVTYLDELELSYHIYTQEHRGRGIATEAVTLMTDYLFNRTKHNRIRLIIHPDNLASKRIAEKCGYQHEGTARGAWFNRGKSQDVEVYARLRNDQG
jgi:RimJ/RimL family protein N-acetyltransferase